MIRVTYIDCYDFKKEHLVTHVLKPLNNCYRFLNIENETITGVSNKCDIKVEKQVKDLTLTELEQLGLEPWYYTNDRLFCVRKKVGLIDETLELDDYIDITEIVKGDKNE